MNNTKTGCLLLDTILMMSNEHHRELKNDPNVDVLDAEVREKIMINGTPDQKMMIERIIKDSFTTEEQKALVEKGGLIISVESLPFEIAGVYYGKEDGEFYKMHINAICLDDGDTLLHELIHHSRMVDRDRKGILLRTRSESDIIPVFNDNDRSLEDAATTIEALTRRMIMSNLICLGTMVTDPFRRDATR